MTVNALNRRIGDSGDNAKYFARAGFDSVNGLPPEATEAA